MPETRGKREIIRTNTRIADDDIIFCDECKYGDEEDGYCVYCMLHNEIMYPHDCCGDAELTTTNINPPEPQNTESNEEEIETESESQETLNKIHLIATELQIERIEHA